MSICMVGIDYEKASVDVRALFAFTKKQAVWGMERLTEEETIFGTLILSTCNRMEVWPIWTERPRNFLRWSAG